jgi:ABC-2 type transport system ATP-binding protein
MSIEVNLLAKQYGEQKAVNQISFYIQRGEIVGFLGPNGAGKSTTMKMITGYLASDSGSVKICGREVAENPIAIKKKIGYLPEANPLYQDMYVREYLGFIAGVHQLANLKEAVEKAIVLTGLSLESKKKISQLSKGYKQRVGLAAALIHDPEVLILDEPTSGLDPNQIIEIRNVIKEQGKDKTVLFSSHILQEVEAICDRVIIIHKGNIVADDQLVHLQHTHTDLHTVTVQFEEAVDRQWMETITEIIKIEQVKEGYFKFQTSSPEKLRKQLLQMAIEHNLNIVSLQAEGHSLEAVFRNLTN